MITVNDEPLEWHQGMTVREVLKAKNFTFHMLGVWVNGIPVAPKEFDTYRVPDGAKIQVIHSISGG